MREPFTVEELAEGAVSVIRELDVVEPFETTRAEVTCEREEGARSLELLADLVF